MNISQAHEISIISFWKRKDSDLAGSMAITIGIAPLCGKRKQRPSRLIVISTGGMTMACPKEGILWSWQSD